MNRGVTIEVDLPALKSNFEFLKKRTFGAKVIAVVKADAYGHGSSEVAVFLEKLDVYAFGVAYVSEAAVLREAGIKKPIIVFFDNCNIDDILDYNLTPVVFNESMASDLSSQALYRNMKIDVHINIDTGMGRVGFLHEKALVHIDRLLKMKGLRIRGVMSHFSDADLNDMDYASLQLRRFIDIKNNFPSPDKDIIWHMANSAAVLSFENSFLKAVRPGLMLYGYSPFTGGNTIKNFLKPVMTVKSVLSDIRKVSAGKSISYGRTFTTKRDSLIGVLPFGYADGYPRGLSNKGSVIINNETAPVIGRVCMDIVLIDLTDIKDARVNDDVILIGNGKECKITAEDIAKKTDTISYEVLTSIGRINEKTYIR